MRGAGVDALGAAHFHQGLGSVAQGAGGIHHIVKEDAVLAGNIADHVHDLALVGLLAALIHDGKVHMQLLGEGTGAGHGADVGRDDHHVLAHAAKLLGVVIHEDGVAQQVIHGDIEEALDLVGMDVHGQHAVSAGGGDHVGHQLGGDGVAGLGLTVLAGIAEIGDNGGDAAGGSAAQGIDHDQQLHEAVIDGLAGGLDHENVAAANGLVDGNGNFAVGEGLHLSVAQLGADLLADVLSQLGVGIAGENLNILTMSKHIQTPSFL